MSNQTTPTTTATDIQADDHETPKAGGQELMATLRLVPVRVLVTDEVGTFYRGCIGDDVVGHAPSKSVVDLPSHPAKAAMPEPESKAAALPPGNDGTATILDGSKTAVLNSAASAERDCWCHGCTRHGQLVDQFIQSDCVVVGVDVQADGFSVCCFHGHPFRWVV